MKPILLVGFLILMLGISAVDSEGYMPAVMIIVGMVLTYIGVKNYEED